MVVCEKMNVGGEGQVRKGDALFLWHNEVRIDCSELLGSIDDLSEGHRQMLRHRRSTWIVDSMPPLVCPGIGVTPTELLVVTKVNPRPVRSSANSDIWNQCSILQPRTKDDVPVAKWRAMEAEDRSVLQWISCIKRWKGKKGREGKKRTGERRRTRNVSTFFSRLIQSIIGIQM